MTVTTLWRGDPGYEDARLGSVWNELKPERYPAGIVLANTVDDVIAAVKLAKERGLKVKARSGGHSWTASYLRSDSLLINISALKEVTVDQAAGTGTVQPGVLSRELDVAIRDDGFFFPTGHNMTVGIGGFLLQGGWGWHSKTLGPACLSVVGVDVVTADGEFVHADETSNTELLWAARGAGSGFFGIVVRFYLRLYPRPKSMMTSEIIYDLGDAEEVLLWSASMTQELPRSIEFNTFSITPRIENVVVKGQVRIITRATAITGSEEESIEALRNFEQNPAFPRALETKLRRPADMDVLFGHGSSSEAPGYRYAVDNMWSSAEPADLVPELLDMFHTVPTEASHAALGGWPMRELPDCALSITGKMFIQAFTGWTEPEDDQKYENWGRDHMRRLERFADGIQLADENLARRPEAKFMADSNRTRLEKLRQKWDPDGRILSYWLGDESEQSR